MLLAFKPEDTVFTFFEALWLNLHVKPKRHDLRDGASSRSVA